jgi:endonuclease YncB( thermonuclease family)
MNLRFVFVLSFIASIANAAPIEPGQIEVLDGDTTRIAGETFRLVGFDAPETYRARCPSEPELGSRATSWLRQLVAGGGLDFEQIRCACRVGTEGTARCNYGRSCGALRARGEDVGEVLIAEVSLPKTRFEHSDGVVRQGPDTRQCLRTVRRAVCRAHPYRAKRGFETSL